MAEARALRLLMSYLTPHQRMTMSRHGFMYEWDHGGPTGRPYVLYDGLFLAQCLSDGTPEVLRGIASGWGLNPRGDLLLAQLLMLRYAPEWMMHACHDRLLTPEFHWRLVGRPRSPNIIPILFSREFFPEKPMIGGDHVSP